MDPAIAKYWEASSKAYNAAKNAFANDESATVVKKELCIAAVYGYLAVRAFSANEGGISAKKFLTWLEKIDGLGIKQAIDQTLEALKQYHNLIPGEYNIPRVSDC